MSLVILLLGLVVTQTGEGATQWLEDQAAVANLFAGLEEAFTIEDVEHFEGAGRVYRLRSTEAVDQAAAGPVHARASFTVTPGGSPEAAAAEVRQRLAGTDPDTGLSYAWDFVTSADDRVLHLHAECTLASDAFRQIAARLAARIAAESASGPSFSCRCGGGCMSREPTGGSSVERRSLPRVEHPDGDSADYDNRLDPSGRWVSDTGSLQLMHVADRLSFSYLAVFGAGAHICEGAGVAGLVARDRYQYGDDQGTVAFVVDEQQVRLEQVEGIASFCGAGWTGDIFAIDGFERPGHCEVATERAYFHVVDHIDPERRPSYVIAGDRVDAVIAENSGETTLALARHVGAERTTVGLLRADALRCGEEP